MTASGRLFQTWAVATGKAANSRWAVWPGGWYVLTAEHADQVGPLKSTGSLCCGVRSKRDRYHSVLNNGTMRAMRPFVNVLTTHFVLLPNTYRLNCLWNAFDRLSNHFGICLCVCLSTNRLSNDYVRNSWPIFTKFCMPLGNLVVSKAVVS